MALNQQEKEFLMQLLNEWKEIPEDFKYKLFPTIQKEYELSYAGKMRKEDLFANEDGVFPVPLQVEKTFNWNEYRWFEDGWKNMIVFWDNLQFLKTIYENKDPIIKDKVKGKVKLIYIDPPFATQLDFKWWQWQKAYADKKKGADFIEFLRRRLQVAKELLHPEGTLLLHLSSVKIHYFKVLLDEIFWEQNYKDEIVWYCWRTGAWHRSLAIATNPILRYVVSNEFIWNKPCKPYTQDELSKFKKDEKWYYYTRWAAQRELKEWEKEKYLKSYIDPVLWKALDNFWDDVWSYSLWLEKVGYPTQKPEKLLERLIKATTNEWDIVMDFFWGSWTTMAVAEKLWRRWISCDLWKLAYFTEQKRILTIQDSKSLLEDKKIYWKKARSFMTCTLWMYNLKDTLDMEWGRYKEFVGTLFDIDTKIITLWWVEFDGKKWSAPVKIWDYNKHKDANVDEIYINALHQSIKTKTSRVYIVAPANNIGFISDYYEIDGTRYYFLKIPYQVIKELHKKSFHKIRQPQSKKNVNDLEDAIGFHFIKKPEVKSKISVSTDEVCIDILEFRSQYYKDEEGKILENFETLSAVFIDADFNWDQFIMTNVKFADDLLPKKKKSKKIQEDEEIEVDTEEDEEEISNDEIREELKETAKNGLKITLPRKKVWDKIMLIYTDIYGNDFTEILTVK